MTRRVELDMVILVSASDTPACKQALQNTGDWVDISAWLRHIQCGLRLSLRSINPSVRHYESDKSDRRQATMITCHMYGWTIFNPDLQTQKNLLEKQNT